MEKGISEIKYRSSFILNDLNKITYQEKSVTEKHKNILINKLGCLDLNNIFRHNNLCF